MPKRVNLPDGRVVNFPDTMSAEDIQAALSGIQAPQAPAGAETEQGGGFGRLAALLGAGGLAAAGIAARKPGLARTGFKKAWEAFQGARHLGALSGTALPKSIVGNIGAPFVAAAERKSLEPIKQFFRPQTVKDYVRGLREPDMARVEAGGEQALRVWNPFGRAMSAGDKATRAALGRAGLTDAEAAEYTLQSSLPELGLSGKFGKAIESPLAKHLIMYRRTPLNAIVHGFGRASERPGLSSIAALTGAAQGSSEGVTGDPLSVAMTAPAAGVYSLPYLLGASVGKLASTGSKGQAGQVSRGLAPIPELGVEIADPLRPINRPAIQSLLERVEKLSRTGRSY